MNEAIFARAYKPGVAWEMATIYFKVLKTLLPMCVLLISPDIYSKKAIFCLNNIIFTLVDISDYKYPFYFCKIILKFANSTVSPRYSLVTRLQALYIHTYI